MTLKKKKLFWTIDEVKEINGVLKDWLTWWDQWNASDDPTEIGDPNIEGTRELIEKIESEI